MLRNAETLKGEAGLGISVRVTLKHVGGFLQFSLGTISGPDCHKLGNHIMHFREATGEGDEEMESHLQGSSTSQSSAFCYCPYR